jgi:predicted enzyme related to lactoylglutathione lyase
VNRIDVLGEAGSPVVSIAQTDDGGRVDLYNQAGTNLLRVSCAPNGGDVAVWDDEGTNVAGIWSTPEGGTFSLWDEKGEELSQFASGALTLSGANASLHIQNESGLPVAVVASDEEGHGRFQIADAMGNVVSEMRMLPGVGGGIIVNTTAGKKMGVLAASESGGHLNLFNAQNVPVFVASTETTGGGAMTVSNQRGIPVITLKSDEDHRGIIEIRDEDGNGIRRMRPLRGYSP